MEFINLLSVAALGVITLLAFMFYYNEKQHKEKMLVKKDAMWKPIEDMQSELKGFREVISEYRKQHIANIDAYNAVHEHLSLATNQMRSLRKNQRILKDSMVTRFELVVSPKNSDKFKAIAKQLEQLS